MREHYKFDEIPGQGSEVSRFLRLMEWAHRITPGIGDLISFQPARHDGDSHSIATVFGRELGRWICLDPTFDTFHDGKGVPLGYLEMRDTYRSGRVPCFRSITIPVEGEMMLAGQAFDGYHAWYAVYTAKNCFKASCPQKRAFGYESSDSPAWVVLHPRGYGPDSISKANTTYTTDSRSLFETP